MPLQQTAPSRSGRRWTILAVALVLAAGAALLLLKGKGEPQANKQARAFKPVVTVAEAARRDVPVYLSGLGNVAALNTVTVRSRVDGQLMEVRFREGDLVKAGDVLAVVDPRPFQTQLAQAEGQMARDKSLLENSRRDLARYEELVKTDAIARQQLDTQQSLVRQYEGAVKTDQGLIDNAKLQLVYSRITAPISGRAGLRLVDAGNMIRTTDATGLVVITEVQPIAVLFTLPEDALPRVQERLAKGGKLTVDALDREQKNVLATGELLTLDNQIDPSTGTVRLKALFPNAKLELFPNQFVNARLLVDTVPQAVVTPAAAVQRGPQGAQVFILGQDDTVAVRKVEATQPVGGEVIVRTGLEAGERVVVEGAERLRDGMQVEVKGAAGPKRQGG